jgi:hypothetical protein
MISYLEALQRHNTTALAKQDGTLAAWIEVEVNTAFFWNALDFGKLAAFEDSNGVYVGIIESWDIEEDHDAIWLWFKHDPTRDPIPETQSSLPVLFTNRNKIMIEATHG